MILLHAILPGTPQTFQRPRFNGAKRSVFDDKWYAAWKAGASSILMAAAGERMIARPVRIGVVAVFDRPEKRPDGVDRDEWKAGARIPYVGTADLDNILKAVGDAMQPTKADRAAMKRAPKLYRAPWPLADDRFICGYLPETAKLYAAVGETAHTVVTLAEWMPAPASPPA